jgi:repressor LexA
MDIANKILSLRQQHGLTQEELGRIAGVTDKAVSSWENGTRLPRIGTIEKIANYFGITKSEIIEGRPPANNTQRYRPNKSMPVLGRIVASLPLYAEENVEGFVANDFEDNYEYYALRVYGDSMTAAGIDDGDLVIVRKQDTVEDNQIAVVIINGYDATVKFFKQKGRMVFLSPKSFNPEHSLQVYDAEKDTVRVLGRVVQIRKDR